MVPGRYWVPYSIRVGVPHRYRVKNVIKSTVQGTLPFPFLELCVGKTATARVRKEKKKVCVCVRKQLCSKKIKLLRAIIRGFSPISDKYRLKVSMSTCSQYGLGSAGAYAVHWVLEGGLGNCVKSLSYVES